MINQKNISKEDLEAIINTFPLTPMFNKVVITLNTEEVDNFLILSDNTMSDQQFIIARGSHVNNLTLGDKVLLDLEKMMVYEVNQEDAYEKISRIKVDPILVDGVTYGIIEDRLIKARYN